MSQIMSGSDDLGGLGDLDEAEDDLGNLDDGGLDTGDLDDDEFDDMGDGGEEMAGGGGNVDELEHRLDELENEVGSLSSTVNTVRNENEQISESVEEVEENVRKLLDIYEMVTRGVNPFADEVDAGMAAGGEMEDSSFGLFTDDEEDQHTESVDEDITEADAEGFFDDDLVEDDEGDDFGDAGDVMDDSGSSEPSEEFDDGDHEMFDDDAEEMFEADAMQSAEPEAGAMQETEPTPEPEPEPAATEPTGEALADDDLFDEVVEKKPAEQAAQQAQTAEQPATQEPAQTQATEQTETVVENTDGKPYLATVPGGLDAELIVVEWLEFLVDSAGRRGAARAIDYYETIDWIATDVAEKLSSYLEEFDFAAAGDGSLGAAHHVQSLVFIDQLDGGDAGATDSASVEVFGS